MAMNSHQSGALVAVVVAALLGTSVDAQTSNSPPPADGYADVELVAPTAMLPSVATCLARVRRSAWEPRAQNNDEN